MYAYDTFSNRRVSKVEQQKEQCGKDTHNNNFAVAAFLFSLAVRITPLIYCQ